MRNTLIAIIGMIALAALFLYTQGIFSTHRIAPGMTAHHATLDISGTPAVVKRTAVTSVDTIVGTVTARQTTQVQARAIGHVQSIAVKPGDTVSKGSALVTLDDRELQSKLSQARSQLKAAEAARDQAKITFTRQDALLRQEATTRASFDQSKTGLDQAEAALTQVQDAIRELEIMRGYTRVVAPYDGVVVEKLVDVGTLVAPGVPLVTIQDPSGLRLEASIPASKPYKLDVGDKLAIRIEDINLTIEGTLVEKVPSTDPSSRSSLVRVSLPSERGLRPGAFGRLLLPGRTSRELVIPPAAVRHAGQLDMVYVQGEHGPESRMVRLGTLHAAGLTVLSGLDEGETVIVPNGEVAR